MVIDTYIHLQEPKHADLFLHNAVDTHIPGKAGCQLSELGFNVPLATRSYGDGIAD